MNDVAEPNAEGAAAASPDRRSLGRRLLGTLSVRVMLGGLLILALSVPLAAAAWSHRDAALLIAVLGAVQLAVALAVVLGALQIKVLGPLKRLSAEADMLAEKQLAAPVVWRRRDELGELGRSVERTRATLRALFTDLERSNVEAQMSEAQKSAVIEAIPDAIISADEQGRILEFNEAAERIFGYGRAMVLGRSVTETIVPEHLRERHASAFRRTVETGERRLRGRRTEFEGLRADGTLFPLEISMTEVRVGGRRLMTAFLRDLSERKQGEQERLRLSQLLQDAVEGIPNGFAVYGPDERIAVCNTAFARLYGAKPGEMVGRSAEQVHRAALALTKSLDGEAVVDREVWLERVMARFRAPDRVPLEIELEDGRWLLLTYHPTTEGGVVLLRTDITSLKQAEATLRESEQRFRGVAAAHPLPVVIVHVREATILYANPAAADLFGKPLDEIVGSSVAQFYPDEEARKSFGRRLRQEHAVEVGEYPMRQPSGRTVWTSITGREIVYEGEPAVVLGIFDLSERKAAEESLRAAEAQQRMILDNLPGRVAFVDGERRHRYVNRQYLELLGLDEEAVLGRTVSEVLGEETGEVLRPLAERALAGEVVRWEGWINYPGGGQRYVSRVYTPNVGPDGKVDGYFAFAEDITEHKLAEQEIERQREALYQSEKLSALGSLLAGVAHELNNPLSVVVGQALMLSEMASDPKIEARAAKIRNAAERCGRIIKTFLAMARQREPERTAVQLNALIEAAIDLLGYGLRTSDIEIRLNLAADLPETWADENLLGQVITNLIVNAQQAMEGSEPPRLLELASEFDAKLSHFRLTVADSGPGVPEAIRSRIFEPFFTTKPVGVGTGIGLSVCHGIVRSHGGTITVADRPGGGATFVVELPYAPPVGEPVAEAASTPEKSPKRVLIVDDEADIAETLAEMLEADGHHTEIARSGRAALERLEAGAYDLILSDLRMPDLDGPALYQRIRERWPELVERMAFITGDTLGLGVSGFLEDCARPYVEKPFTPEDVRAVVARVLAPESAPPA